MNVNTNFKIIWFARLISILGTELTSFGVGVWIYSVTGKATPMAITLLCSILPAIIFAPLSGIVCDRYNRKYIILLADSFAALMSLLLLVYIKNCNLRFSVICLFVFFSSVANTFDNNAYQSSITTLVTKDELKKANGLNQIIDSLGNIISPVLAGILYSLIGLIGIIIVDLTSYALSLLLFIRVDKVNFTSECLMKKERNSQKNFQGKFMEGWKFISSQKSLFSLLIYFTLLNFFFNISTSLIEPLCLTIGNSIKLGVVKACGGIGILCGSFFVTKHEFKNKTYITILFCGVCSGMALLFMGSTSNYICIAIGRFIFSGVVPILSTLAGTLWMKETPQHLQGRVFATRSMILRCFMPLSYLLVGPIADIALPRLLESGKAFWLISALGDAAISYRMVFVSVGICVIVLTASMMFNRRFKDLV